MQVLRFKYLFLFSQFTCLWLGDMEGDNEILSECVLLSRACSCHSAHVEARKPFRGGLSLPTMMEMELRSLLLPQKPVLSHLFFLCK